MTALEVQNWSCQLGVWMGLKMVEALHKGLAPDCAGTEPGTKASQQEK